MRVSEKVTAWWLKGYAWILLPLVAASWLPGVPPLGRVVVGASWRSRAFGPVPRCAPAGTGVRDDRRR